MGVEYDLVSDASKEAYELGKGSWGWLARREPPWIAQGENEFGHLVYLGSEDEAFKTNVASMARYIDYVFRDAFESAGERGKYVGRVGTEIAAFMAKNSDWRLVDDSNDDYSVTLSGMHLRENHDDWPCYKFTGTRYEATLFICEACGGRDSKDCRGCDGSAWVEWTRGSGARPLERGKAR